MPRLGQRLDLGRVDMHAVGGDRLRAEDAAPPQPLDDADAVLGQAVVLVARGLGAHGCGSRRPVRRPGPRRGRASRPRG